MSDRHQELLRQHALVRAHLAWLEREIAREAAAKPDETQPPAASAQPEAIVEATAPLSPASVDPDALLNDYAKDERHDPRALRRGCLLAFAIAIGSLVCAVTAVYFLFYVRR